MSDVQSAAGKALSQAFQRWNRSPEKLGGDGLPNDQDPTPHDADTAGDGLADGEEVAQGTDPLRADTDGEILSDGLGADPTDSDSDYDGRRVRSAAGLRTETDRGP